jgi:hypothetical protein
MVMFKRLLVLTWFAWAAFAGTGYTQQCLHDESETNDQAARRRDALTAARLINTIELNQPGAAARSYLRQSDLESAPYVRRIRESKDENAKQISLTPDTEIVTGWRLTLDVSDRGYWFMIKDINDPCGFAYISREAGLIFRAEPIR